MSEWSKCSEKQPPKDVKFLYYYYGGIGLGQWSQCYTDIIGNSERTHEGYILILHPSEINDGQDPWQTEIEDMIACEMFWMPLPEGPKDE